ncbi:MAG: peptide-methionine (R)-S-oxide reductase MsrB [Dehalococcoidia bacterium]|nr:peptide-methionine (R)-S-oxide reductase MsrB [Dehalococcoidia bacterium]
MPDRIKVFDVKKRSIVEVERIEKSPEEWRKVLSPEQYEVTVLKGTEYPGSCLFSNVGTSGIFQCVRCGTDLFDAHAKYESGTGWPSYFRPVSPLNIIEVPDYSHGMQRTEVICARCHAHLGHVFHDGPPPTGLRYCINGVALKFVAEASL